MERVQNHLKNEGAFHDNQCPRCPERFASRDEFVNHLETSNHIGMRTMYYHTKKFQMEHYHYHESVFLIFSFYYDSNIRKLILFLTTPSKMACIVCIMQLDNIPKIRQQLG